MNGRAAIALIMPDETLEGDDSVPLVEFITPPRTN